MKRFFALSIVVGLILALSSGIASGATVSVTGFSETTKVIRKYDYWGNLLSQSSKTTTVVTIETTTKETTEDGEIGRASCRERV
jgi:hypothetical protein